MLACKGVSVLYYGIESNHRLSFLRLVGLALAIPLNNLHCLSENNHVRVTKSIPEFFIQS
jgi:hypothetical protein